MTLTGDMLIGSSNVPASAGTMKALSPATGEDIGPEFALGGPAEVDRAAHLADEAFDSYNHTGLKERAAFLELIAMRPGSRTRLCHRLRAHPAGKGKRRSLGERDFIALIDGAHQLVKAPIVLVWDRLNTHVSRRMRQLITEREWLTVFLLPAYSPDLNPVEGVWAHVKRSLANLAVVALDRLEVLVRNRLKRLQYRPDTLNGFIAGTGLDLDAPTSP